MKKLTLATALLALFLTAPLSSAMAMSSDGGAVPDIPEFKAGAAAIEAKNFTEAEKQLMISVKNNPTHPDSWSMLGFASRMLGKKDAAFHFYGEALKVDKEFRPALNYLGHLYLETGQLDKAKDMLARLDTACFFGCPEFYDLKDAVAAGKSGKY